MNKWWLILILLLAIFLRFYKLGESPKGFYVDEAAIGYNAYSLMLTGKDEYDKDWPVLLRSFTDFKAPVYSYLLIPIYKVLGMSVYTTRLLSAMAGVGSVLMLYLLVKKIANDRRLALVSALMMAISPWSIIFSRTTYETNLALFFMITAVYCWYLAMEKRWWWMATALFSALAVLTYHAQRMVVPLLFLSLMIYFKKKILIRGNYLPIMLTVGLGMAMIFPTLMVVRTKGFMSRATTLNIFNYEHQNPSGYIKDASTWVERLVNIRPLLTIKEFGSLYISYFSPRYLFNLGDAGPRSSYPELSTFFIWQLPFYLYGWWWLFKGKNFANLKVIVWPWLLIAPIPAALTRDPYSTIRALSMVVPLVIMVAVGVERLLRIKWGYWILGLGLVYSISRLMVSVLVQNDFWRYSNWDYGLEEVVEKIKQDNNQNQIIMDSFDSLAYIQTAFFLKYDPVLFQKQNGMKDLANYYNDVALEKYKYVGRAKFGLLDWKEVGPNQVLIASPLGISDQQVSDHNLRLLWEIKGPDNKILYRGFKTADL